MSEYYILTKQFSGGHAILLPAAFKWNLSPSSIQPVVVAKTQVRPLCVQNIFASPHLGNHGNVLFTCHIQPALTALPFQFRYKKSAIFWNSLWCFRSYFKRQIYHEGSSIPTLGSICSLKFPWSLNMADCKMGKNSGVAKLSVTKGRRNIPFFQFSR